TLKAFSILAKMDPAIKLYIVGSLSERPKRLLSKVKEEFSRRIICLGHVSKTDLRDLYSRVKVTSVPSIYQVPVLSPTVLESLASGTPVIGGSTAISCDLLVDNYNGFRVHPNDFNTLAKRISILTENKELWDKLSVNARSIAENFDASAVSKKYVDLYRTWNGRSL
ncbi:glycosyltransferase, partial [Candidatus Bathyarchaeota archaeon]|nr:glycosyltransferase [Candidatus Bathyarchaeota archaeon]